MKMKSSILCIAVLAIALGLTVTATAAPYEEILFTENYGDFVTNNAAGYAYVWKTAQATMTGAPSPLPAPMYLVDWTYALSSTGYGCTDGMYLAVLEYDGTGWGDLVGISSTYVDMGTEFGEWVNAGHDPITWSDDYKTVTWQFDYVPLQPDTLYAMTFLWKDPETGTFYIVLGGIELGTSDAFEGGFDNTGDGIVNQTAWEAHYIATYSDVTPYPAYTAPADGTTNLATDVQLSWTAPSAYTPVGYNVYVDPYEPNLTAAEAEYYIPAQTGTTYIPDPELLQGVTYYWRVEALEPNDVGPNPIPYSGPVWEFTTVPPSVVVTGDPVSQTVEAGATVELSVTALNADIYQWYKDGDPLTGATTDTLTIPNVQVADEGIYTCTVSNSLPSSETSGAAQVMTRRLAGWWKLDGDLTDSVQEQVAGAPTHNGTCADPNYIVTAKNGGGLEFFGDAAGLVIIGESNNFFNFYPQGYTVSCWVNMPPKPDDWSDPWGAFVCKQGFDPQRGFILTNNNIGDAVHTLRQSFNDLYSGYSADTDSWRLITGTYDADTKTGMIYFDGSLRNQATSTSVPEPADAPLIFGAENLDATVAPYSGKLDDVRIWTYPLDAYEVAALYVEFNPGGWVCIENPEFDTTGPAGVPDCKVDLYEFVEIAAKWLECERYPESSCD